MQILLNVMSLCAFNSLSLGYDIVARTLMTRVSANAYKHVFRTTFELVTDEYPSFNNGQDIHGTTADFSLAQVKGLDDALDNAKGLQNSLFLKEC